jgi:shikimate dehydrogenase
MSSIAAHSAFAPSSADVLVGLVGAGIQESLTPAMHMHEGLEQGLAYDYRLIDLEPLGLGPEALPELLAAAEHAGFAGLNITHPCKQAVLQHLDALSDDARALGAVNTVVLRGGGRVGHNTDWWGFAKAFEHELGDVSRGTVVQLGAGGAGAAVAHALLTLGTKELRIIDTDRGKASELARALGTRFASATVSAGWTSQEAMQGADGLVNTTPVGMAKYPGLPIEAGLPRQDCWIADIIYFPLETELLRRARALGCRTMNGGGMAVFQAVGAFELFCGRPADAHRMQKHFAELTGAAVSA